MYLSPQQRSPHLNLSWPLGFVSGKLPESIAEELKIHLQAVKIIHQQDLQKGYGSVYLPFALEKNIQKQSKSGLGSLFFFRAASPKIPVVEKFVVTTSMKVVYKKH